MLPYNRMISTKIGDNGRKWTISLYQLCWILISTRTIGYPVTIETNDKSTLDKGWTYDDFGETGRANTVDDTIFSTIFQKYILISKQRINFRPFLFPPFIPPY